MLNRNPFDQTILAKSATATPPAEGQTLEQEFTGVLETLEAFSKANSGKTPEATPGKTETPNPTGAPTPTPAPQTTRIELVTKSVKVGDGEQADLVDPEQMVQAIGELVVKAVQAHTAPLVEEIKALRTELQQVKQSQTEGTVMLAKSAAAVTKGVMATAQAIDDMGKQGKPRKSVLTIVGKSATASGKEAGDDDPKQAQWPQIMAKSIEMVGQGKLTAADVSVLQGCANRGAEVPQQYKFVEQAIAV